MRFGVVLPVRDTQEPLDVLDQLRAEGTGRIRDLLDVVDAAWSGGRSTSAASTAGGGGT